MPRNIQGRIYREIETGGNLDQSLQIREPAVKPAGIALIRP